MSDQKIQPAPEAKAAEAKEIPGRTGAYQAIAMLRPWRKFEEQAAYMRIVAKSPSIG